MKTEDSGEEGGPMDDEEDYADAVNRHAKYIGIDPKEDADYMWIAKEVRATLRGSFRIVSG